MNHEEMEDLAPPGSRALAGPAKAHSCRASRSSNVSTASACASAIGGAGHRRVRTLPGAERARIPTEKLVRYAWRS